MQGSRTALKVISIIILIYAIIVLIMSIISIVSGSIISAAPVQTDVETLALAGVALAAGIALLFTGLVYLLVGILGLRGANNPKKIGPFFVISVIGVVLSVISLITSIAGGGFDPTSLVGLIIVVVCMLLAYNIRKYARRTL